MNVLQNIDAMLGIVVSAVTILGFLGIMLRGRARPQPLTASEAQIPPRRARFPVIFLIVLAVAGVAVFGWMAGKGNDRDGFSRWRDSSSGAIDRPWRRSRDRARR